MGESPLSGSNEEPESTDIPHEKQGKKRKVRSVWIAFVGRVVAQFVGSAATKDEAVTKARAQKPGLVLADINLGDGGSGIDAVTEILRTFDIPVIFITAYPERLLTGERPEPTYLITKPFLPETVQATIGQALFFHSLRREAA